MSGLARNALQSAKEKDKKEGTAKVARYRAGQVPKWAEEEEAEAGGTDGGLLGGRRGSASGLVSTSAVAPVVVKPGSGDRRLQRLAGRASAAADPHRRRRHRDDGEDDPAPARGAAAGSGDTDEEDEEELAERRRRIRAAQLREEEAGAGPGAAPGGAPGKLAADESEEYYSSEYETDTSEDDGASRLAKPVFVSRRDRTTTARRGNSVQTTWKSTDEVEKRQRETREIVKQMAVNEFGGGTDGRSLEDVDTDDEKDKAAEYEAWRLRELDRLELEWKAENGFRELEAEAEAAEAAMDEDPKDKGDRAFLQKYYHKGAFFQNVSDGKLAVNDKVEEVYKKDYSAPTGEDLYNKAVLPKVMQRRNFGKRSQSKWTHLSAEDTSKLGDDYKPHFRPRRKEEGRRGAE